MWRVQGIRGNIKVVSYSYVVELLHIVYPIANALTVAVLTVAVLIITLLTVSVYRLFIYVYSWFTQWEN